MKSTDESACSSQRELFLKALERRTQTDRDAFLNDACGGDATLRASIDELLAHHREDSFLEESPASNAFAISESGIPAELFEEEAIGDRIGRYKLLQKLGEGGCGVVYMAEQEEPVRRRVALKVIKLGMDTKSVIARFEAERQALALMDHPNIARVLDAGATDKGRPYFVMELVHGTRITDYCDQHQLSTRGRLDLFIKVCQAIQHAHQRGIIHRDIKPSNIMVTLNDGVAAPKVIDFGIAKATSDQSLTDKTVFTALEQFIGTPAYMSPEQAEMSGLDLDTRCDIYSLGVLLYEMLTGKPPFNNHELLTVGLDEMRRIIREVEPERPSTRLAKTVGANVEQVVTLEAGIDPDLDWIVLKCLEKDRSRRYESASGVATDLGRYLANEPVLARAPTATYKIGKFVRRNKTLVAVTAVISAVLLLGTGISTWQAIRATRAQHAARRVIYGAETSQGFEALESDNLGRAREFLNKQQSLERSKAGSLESNVDSRGWEWRHLWHRTRGDEHIALAGHEDMVAGVLFLNDGRTIASGGMDNTLRVWDFAKRTNILTIPLRNEGSHFLCLSPDGHWLAVGADPWQLFDTETWQSVPTEKDSSGASALAFSDDSKRLALISGPQVRVLDLASRDILTNLNRGEMQWERKEKIALAFSPDGEWLAYGDAEAFVRLHKFADHTELLLHPEQTAHSVSFTRDGKFLISGGRSGIDVWDTAAGTLARHLSGHRDEVSQVTVSRDGSLLASASVDQTVRLWHTTSWKEIATFRGHHLDVASVSFSPDGTQLVSAGRDEKLRVWKVEKLPVDKDRFISPDNAPYHWPFAPGHRIALVQGNLHYAPGLFEISNFTPKADALRLLGDRGAVTYLDCLTLEASAPEPTPPSFSSVKLMVFGLDARSMALGWTNGRVEFWATGPFRRLRKIGESTNAPLHLVLSANGQRLAVHRADNAVEVWNPVTGALDLSIPQLADVHGGPNFEFWAQDRILAINVVRAIDLRFLPEGRQRVFSHPKGNVWFHAVSNDGRWLATSSWDGLLRLWDVESGQEERIITGQRIVYYSLIFSPDDSRLIGGGYDGTITIWDMATHQQVAHWKAHDRECAWLRFVGPDQDLISAGNLNSLDRYQGEIRRWRAPSLSEIDAQRLTERLPVTR